MKVVLKMTKTIILEIFHTQSIMKSAANNLSRIFGHMLRGKKSYFLLIMEAQLKKSQNLQPEQLMIWNVTVALLSAQILSQ